ncbi:TonB-dependent receptor [Methylocapsa palsarum]|nr:TonB-dependent receptor [Methylocapsa palsarum]
MKKRKQHRIGRRVGLPLCLGLTMTTAAFAQDAAPPAEGHVEDVVVSAGPEDANPTSVQAVSQKQATAYQEKAVSATVITQEQIQSLNITNLAQAQKLEPSLQFRYGNVRNLTFNIRGFGASSSNATDGIYGGVPIYIDGVYQPRPGQAVFDIPDLIGVQVLKGPQGTSGGQDSTGGIVNISTALPSFVAQETGEISYGNYNFVQLKASATGAIADSDKAAFRLSVFDTDRQGYISNYNGPGQNFSDWHDKGARLQFLYTPTEDLTARFTLSYAHVNQACCVNLFAGAVTNYANGAAVPNNFYTRIGRLNYNVPTSGAPQNYIASINGYLQTAQENYGASASIDYRFNGFTLSSISSFQDWEFHPNNRENALIAPQLVTNTNGHVSPSRSVVEDIKISSPKGLPVEGFAGLFYLYEQLYDFGLTTNGSDAALYYKSPALPIKVANAAYNYLGRQTYDNPLTNQIAPYAQGVWHATPELDITGGVRYSYYAKESIFRQYIFTQQDYSGLTPAQAALAKATSIAFFGADKQYTANTHQGILSFLGSASYKFTPDILGYVTVSQGGRGGGPNPVANLPAGVPVTVNPEIVQNYEAGLKGSFLDQKLLTNLAGFVMYNHGYITNASAIVGGNTVTYLANAGGAVSRGVEFDVRYRPIEELNTYASFTYDDAFYSDYKNAACPFELSNTVGSCNLTGKPLPITPKFAMATGFEYAKNLGQVIEAFQKPLVGYGGVDWTYQTQIYSLADDSIYSRIPGYGLLNIHAGVRFEDGSWDLQAWAHNALNKRYWLNVSATALPGGAIGGLVGDPLMVGFTLRAKL